MRGALLTLALLAAPGCLSVSWAREARYTPVPEERLLHLKAGESDLGACLATLGAPLWVWEHGQGLALAYGWFDERNLGLHFSVPLSENASASFDYDTLDERLHGVVLFFDRDWVLTALHRGYLRDLTREARRPPAALEEDT